KRPGTASRRKAGLFQPADESRHIRGLDPHRLQASRPLQEGKITAYVATVCFKGVFCQPLLNKEIRKEKVKVVVHESIAVRRRLLISSSFSSETILCPKISLT